MEQRKKETVMEKEMEIIGLLSSEIAHDFNNILTGIMGYSQIMLMDMDENDKSCRGIKEIENAANKGSGIAEVLSSLKLRNIQKEKDVNINEVIKKNESKLFGRLVEGVTKRLELKAKSLVDLDPLLLANILYNLIIFLTRVIDLKSIDIKTEDVKTDNICRISIIGRGGLCVEKDSIKFFDAAESIKRFKLQGAALYIAKERAVSQNISLNMVSDDNSVNIQLAMSLKGA